MKVYKLKTTKGYYDCDCTGRFYADMTAKTYGSVFVYVYKCDKCGTRKAMRCQTETREQMCYNKGESEKRQLL